MGDRRIKIGPGRGQGAWPVLLLLLVAVVVPTACVLWFMTEAVRNERLAVRQKLTEAYRSQLAAVQDRLETHWQDRIAGLAEVDSEAGAAEHFARLVQTGLYDSVIVYDRSGRLLYPLAGLPPAAEQERQGAQWLEARSSEYERSEPAAAAAAYAKIADQAADVNEAARALRARARCLAKAGRTDAAVQVLTKSLAEAEYRNAIDPNGRFIVPDAQLFALQLIGEPHRPEYRTTLRLLGQRLTDYREPALPSSQRRFLMQRLQSIAPDCPPFDTLAAEDLAGDYLETDPLAPKTPALARTGLSGVWQLASSDGTIVALLREARVVAEAQSLITSHVSVPNVIVEILVAGEQPGEPPPFLTIDAAAELPEWRLALYLEGPDPFAAAADRQIAAYRWAGLLVIVVIAALAVLVARYVGRQMKLTRLKNDLIATVSHELKTPLASMRVLVDTLLEGRCHDRQQAQEYLQLVAKENTRLSRLIDNFLTFSRMERNKRAFEFNHLHVEQMVATALDAVGDRFDSAGCRLDVKIQDNLPAITGDRDALITVMLNLLDNAYKYTGDDKRIALRVYASDANLCLEVADNGVGLSRRAAKKIFDRFYQVDRSLSRRAGGCGLGLSIVKFIVEAHAGSITVASRPGEGSTFTVKLPINRKDER